MPTFKIAIYEKDGVEYGTATEYDLGTALSEVGYVGTSNFSFNVIESNLTIPVSQQMLVYQEIDIKFGFELNILGELVILD